MLAIYFTIRFVILFINVSGSCNYPSLVYTDGIYCSEAYTNTNSSVNKCNSYTLRWAGIDF